MKRAIRFGSCVAAGALAFAVGALAEAPHVYAIRGARIVSAAGAPIASGTVVIRNGVIEAVGPEVAVPADAVTIDGKGLTAYPGLIDMGTATGLDVQVDLTPPSNLRTTEERERWKRDAIFRPQITAADHLRPDSTDLARLAAIGVTTVLSTPPGALVRGQSALVNVASPPDEPQIGALADRRKGLQVVRTPVALHVALGASTGRGGYPGSLLGSIAFVRQHFLDAQHHQAARQRYERSKVPTSRPVHDPALEALEPALGRRVPVAFDADHSREILRALAIAKEFNLDPVITGGLEADQVVADLKAQNARIIYSLNFPTRPRMLPPDYEEPLRELRARAHAPKAPAALEKAGLLFAFASDGLREPQDFLRNVRRAVKEGLSPDAAVRALTIDAARIAGAEARLGSIERGKVANLILIDGDLFAESTKVTHVFVEGRLTPFEEAPAGRERR